MAVVTPDQPLEPTVESLPIESQATLHFKLPDGYLPDPLYDWFTLIRLGIEIGPVDGYGIWQWNRPAQTEGDVSVIGPDEPGLYEWRYYSLNGDGWYDLLVRSTPIMFTPTAEPDLWIMGTTLTDLEKEQNAITLQRHVDLACATDGNLQTPAGDICVNLTEDRPWIRVWNKLTLSSVNKTTFHVGPDQTEVGSTRELFHVEVGNFVVDILPGIEVYGPHYVPYLEQNGVIYSVGEGFACHFLRSVASKQPGYVREIKIRELEMFADVPSRRGFDHVALIEADTEGSTTNFVMRDSLTDSFGNGIAAFGSGSPVYVERNRIRAGWWYGPGQNGTGNVLYVHQGRPLYVRGNTIITRAGRDCVKYAGVRSEGRGNSNTIDSNVFRSERVEFVKQLGLTPQLDDYHWGTGVGLDKFAECGVDNNYFESSLGSAIQHWGKATLRGGIVECPRVFSAGGDQIGEHPMITCIGVRMNGVRTVMSSMMENADWIISDLSIETDEAETLFAVYTRFQRVFLSNIVAKILNANGRFKEDDAHMGPNEWHESNIYILNS